MGAGGGVEGGLSRSKSTPHSRGLEGLEGEYRESYGALGRCIGGSGESREGFGVSREGLRWVRGDLGKVADRPPSWWCRLEPAQIDTPPEVSI